MFDKFKSFIPWKTHKRKRNFPFFPDDSFKVNYQDENKIIGNKSI